MNGRELLLRMRAMGATFPIILLSAMASILSEEERVLFSRCIDKGEPVSNLLDVIATSLDPNEIPDFGCESSLSKTAIFSYNIGNLPGQSWAQFNWTDKPKIDLREPFGRLPSGTNAQAVGILLGSPSIQGVPINYKSDSWVTIGNISQYLLVKDHSRAIAGKLASGQPLRGIGVFARLGYAPEQTNTISRDASIALFAHGLFDLRKNDSFGAGFYYNGISSPLKLDIERLSGRKNAVQNEKGSEIFYDFAITPALRFIPSYQHIWDPLTAEVTRNQRGADVFHARFTVIW
jgi:hypothetical protein